MLDNYIKNIYNTHIKSKMKYIYTILLYLLYQMNFLPTLISELGFNIYKLSKIYKIFI